MHSSTLHKQNTFRIYFIVIFTTQPAACVSVYSCLVNNNFMFPPDTKLFVVPYFPSLYLPLNPLSLLLQMLLILSMHLIKLIMFILLHLLLHMLMHQLHPANPASSATAAGAAQALGGQPL